MINIENLTGNALKGYTLHELIGQGGFGAIYRATQQVIGREVAVKIILPEHANQPEFIRRFEAEAQLVARLEHLHIVPLYDYWREPDGAYLVMRWLRGGTLQTSLDKGVWTLQATARLLYQIAGALSIAHQSGVIHRDVKPANILLDTENNAYLTDFGIALDTLQENPVMPANKFAGSARYISPEQINMQPLSPRSDIYSLGIILFEMLAGYHPYADAKTNMAILGKHLYEPLPPIPDLPPGLQAVVYQAAAKEPADRYPDAYSLAAAFKVAVTQVSDFTPPPNAEGAVAEFSTYDITPFHERQQIANPYKGLRAFQEGDAADFYGREALTQHLIDLLQTDHPFSRFLAVVGPSGSGKSSVVQAGLIPALRHGKLPGSDDWYMVEMTPDTQPIQSLAASLLKVCTAPQPDIIETLSASPEGLLEQVRKILPDSSSQLVLIIDQFEELFTRTDDLIVQRHFLQNLYHAVTAPDSQIYIIVTMRADFYDRPLLFADFSILMQQRTEVIIPLTSAELEQAINAPAQRLGLALEKGLSNAIITEVREQPGILPMLQYALTELFERRNGSLLTYQAYQEIGGVLGALARRADEVYDQFNPAEQAALRQLALRLVTLGEGTEDTRRRALQSELLSLTEDRAVIQKVLDSFGHYRLLTFDRDPKTRTPTVEIAHEALIRVWQRLRHWLDENRQDIRLQRLLAQAAHEWHASKQQVGYLLREGRLAQFEEWAKNSPIALTEIEKSYLAASIAEQERLAQVEEQRRANELRLERHARQRSRWVIALLLVALFGGALMSIAIFRQSQNARRERDRAEDRASELQSLLLADAAANAFRENKNELALILALEAAEIENAPRQVHRLLYDIAYTPGSRFIIAHEPPMMALASSPDSRYALTGSGRATPLDPPEPARVKLWDLQTGELVRAFGTETSHTDTIFNVDFSPDGRYAASASADKTAIIWDVATGQEIHRLTAHTDFVSVVEFSPDGKYLVTGSGNTLRAVMSLPGDDNRILIWDVETGELLREFNGHKMNILAITFSPDGQLVASGSASGELLIWDFATGEIRQSIPDLVGWVPSLDFSPDGKTIVGSVGVPQFTSSERGVLQQYNFYQWDVETGEQLQAFVGHGDMVSVVAFSPDGLNVLSGSTDLTMRLWDVATGIELQRFPGHTYYIFQVVYTPDGNTALTVAIDGTFRAWNIRNGAEEARMLEKHRGINFITYAPDNQFALAGYEDGTALLWNLADQAVAQSFEGHTAPIVSVAISPDGKLALTSSIDKTARLWDIASGEELQQFEHGDAVLTAAFSPDGSMIITGTGNQTENPEETLIRLWDVATGEEIRQLAGHDSPISDVTFSPDGSLIASSSDIAILNAGDNSVRLWDAASGEQLHVIPYDQGISTLAFSPDSRTLLVGSEDGRLFLWDVATAQVIRRFVGHIKRIESVHFSADGRQVFSSGDDGTIRIWEVATGAELRRISQPTEFDSIDISQDEQFILSGSVDGLVRVWRLRPMDELLEWVDQYRYQPAFTCEERIQYRIEPLCVDSATYNE